MPDEPTHTLSRRTFLVATGLVPFGLRVPTVALEVRRDLPPRVIGLRSLGGSFRFDPPGLLVEPGAEVRWMNMGDFHTATAFHPDYADLLGGDVPLRIPDGAEPWHSGMLGLDAGTRFSHRLTVEGVYDYFCQPHYSFGMVGRIVVAGPDAPPEHAPPISELNEASREQMPPLERITGPAGATYEWASRVNGVLYAAAYETPEDPSEAAAAVRDGATSDATLERLAGDAWNAVGDGLDDLVTKAGETDYEALVRSADQVKATLRDLG